MPPLASWTVLEGDARELLRELAPGSVQCVVTSPPYWGLRDYGSVGQIGLEPTPDAYVASLVAVFAEVWRVLKDDGTVWLNIGDSYSSGVGEVGRNDETPDSLARRAATFGTGTVKALNAQTPRRDRRVALTSGLKPKDLIGIPWRVAFALQANGWYLRSDIIWAKPNPMPESVTDRPTTAHEHLFLLAKSERYYYDAASIADAAITVGKPRFDSIGGTSWPGRQQHSQGGTRPEGETRNKRSVWTVPTQPYTGAHFATFPEALIRPCVLAGCPVGGLVCDPFCGSGTTGAVAVGLGRNFIGCELNSSYVQLARKRIGDAAPLFAAEAVQEAVARPVPVADPELF